MNTRRVSALVLWVCVAALSVCGCASAQSPDTQASEVPPISENHPKGYDRWEEADGGPADIPEMTAMAKQYGLGSINIPTDEYLTDGYIGVSQLEKYCVAAFSTTKEAADQGLMNVTVLSRLNASYVIMLPSLPAENVKPMLDKYRPLCDGEVTLDDMTAAPDKANT